MDEVRDKLVRDGQAFGRTAAAHQRSRERLGETIRSAYAAGVGPAEITRLIGHRLTEKTIGRIIHDKA